jgi:hypothetical protein
MRTWLVVLAALAGGAAAPAQTDNIGHDRHKHPHNPAHATEAPTPARFVTTRKSEIALPLPKEDDAFSFVIFGDRTGGPVDGVKVLADAVRDVNLLEPDLVMTVGDLVNGYNDTPKWLEQAREYKEIMSHLLCPWFPASGNHDIYWRGEGKPAGEHESNYEMHFGPLWYAFEHKNCWFIVLYSDEGNPETGEKNFVKPECQRISPAQFEFLKSTLSRAKGADHVFLFLHHPRWLGGNYGDDWNRVHALLKEAGNVAAVFAGHIHRMRYDPRDGIEYVALATVGGSQSSTVPDAGWLHQYHVVTVRKKQVAMAAFPVGSAMDVREITGDLGDECARFGATPLRLDGLVDFRPDGSVRTTVRVALSNPTSREADVTVAPDSADSRWLFAPDHHHARLKPGADQVFEFEVRRGAWGIEETLRPLEFVADAEVLMPGHRYVTPTRRRAVAMSLASVPGPTTPERNMGLRFDGSQAVRVWNDRFELPDGPMTVEARFKASRFTDRMGLVCKTETSEYGLFVSQGKAEFSILLGQRYAALGTTKPVFTLDTWHHFAGVYDGREVRMYVDGALVGSAPASGTRRVNALPLIIGADTDPTGNPVSHFRGVIDGVRVSKAAVYSGERFTAPLRLERTEDTVLLTNMDALPAGWLWLEAPAGVLGEPVGSPAWAPVE